MHLIRGLLEKWTGFKKFLEGRHPGYVFSAIYMGRMGDANSCKTLMAEDVSGLFGRVVRFKLCFLPSMSSGLWIVSRSSDFGVFIHHRPGFA